MSTERHSLNEEDIDNVANLAEGFSGADMRSLCGEAALGPIRTLPMSQITNIQSDEVFVLLNKYYFTDDLTEYDLSGQTG